MTINLFARESTANRFRFCNDLVELDTEDRLQFIDLTEWVRERVRRSRVRDGLVNVHTKHTTTSIVVNENERLLLEDFKDLLERWVPGNTEYRHDRLEERQLSDPAQEPRNGDSHGRALSLGCSETLNIVDGELQLGTWQSVFLVELDGARRRQVSLSIIGVGDEPQPLP